MQRTAEVRESQVTRRFEDTVDMEKIRSHDRVQNLLPKRLVDGLVPQIRKKASEDVTGIPLEIDHGWTEVKKKGRSGVKQEKKHNEKVFQFFLQMPGSNTIMLDVLSGDTVKETK